MSGDEQALSDLRELVGGRVFVDSDPDYDHRRAIFNGMIDRRPAAVVACQSAADVAAAVKAAVAAGLEICVKGGGHGISGNAIKDGALMIDLTDMKQLDVDSDSKVVHAGPGLRLGEFIVGTEAAGFVSPRMHCLRYRNRRPIFGRRFWLS